jgi:hypothetical protein
VKYTQRRIVARDCARGVEQVIARDVDGHVRGRRFEMIEQLARLRTGAAAELDDRSIRADLMRHVAGVRTHDLQLGPREIVLGQLANAVEQKRAELVVEPHRRQLARLLAHTFEHSVGECVGARRCGLRARMLCHG